MDWIIPPYLYSQIERGAKNRGIIYSLNKEYVENLYISQNKCCALTGINIIFARSREETLTTASLDRINSDVGYIEENVQWIHKDLNRMKNIFPNDKFINWCKLVTEFHKEINE